MNQFHYDCEDIDPVVLQQIENEIASDKATLASSSSEEDLLFL